MARVAAVASFARHRRFTLSSFPRRRESTPQTFGDVPFYGLDSRSPASAEDKLRGNDRRLAKEVIPNDATARGAGHVRGGSRGIGLCLICGRPLRTRIGDRRISTCARLQQACTSSAQCRISTLPGRVLTGYEFCPTEPLLALDKLCLKWYLSSRRSRVLTARFDGRLASHEAPAREQYFGQALRLRLKFAWIRVTK